jgi:hypothetical protein
MNMPVENKIDADALADQYYNGLDWYEFAHDDGCRLIFLIEAAAYCESHPEELGIKRARHKERCDRMLNKITNGRRSDFGGTYESICDSPNFKTYFHVTRPKSKKKRDTRIHPHISEIKQLVEFKKTGKTHIRILRPGYKLGQHRHIFERSVRISESLARQTSKTRAMTDSIQISDRVSITVTHANQASIRRSE